MGVCGRNERLYLFTMDQSDHSPFRHTHDFVPDFSGAERRTRIVIGITAVMMVLEIAVGLVSHSMALLADAFTSVLAIIALTGGKFAGWSWLDPIMGIVGSGVVFSWAYALLRDTSGILLDRTPPSSNLPDEIRRAVESDGDSLITDLHVWQVGTGKFAPIVSIVAHEPRSSDEYRELLREHEELVHLTIETQHCREHEPHS